MHEEQIDQIMQEISLFGRLSESYSAQDATESLCNIRASLEELVAHPSVTQPWHMIADGETYMVITTGVDAYVYCHGMNYEDAWDLVRRLNGIEE